MAHKAAKVRYWRSVYEEYTASGLGVKEFCAEKSLNYYTFKEWRQEFEREHAGAFIEVGAAALSEASYTLVLKGGRELRVSGGFNEARVRQLIKVCEDA